MKVQVLLFAGLRDRAERAQLELDRLEPGVSVREVIGQLEGRWPFLRGYPFRVARNCEFVEESQILEDGDELALLPPVSGG